MAPIRTPSTSRSENTPPPRGGRPLRRDAPLGIKAVEQAIDILEALAGSVRARSLVELSAETGMEPSKLHRYLVSLCARGLLKQAGALYDLGPAALSLGMQSLARLDEPGVFRAEADRLSAKLSESSFVYVWSQGGPVLIHTCQPAYALVNIRIGSTAPLLDTAAGPVFYAFLPETSTRAIIARDAPAAGLDLDEAMRLMRETLVPPILRDRVCWSDRTILPNTAACAAPVLDAQGKLACVIGASVFRHDPGRPDRTEFIDAVRHAAESASRSIGYVPA